MNRGERQKQYQQQPEEHRRKLIENIALTVDVHKQLKLYTCADGYTTYSKIISNLMAINDALLAGRTPKPLEKRQQFYVESSISSASLFP
jgi:hypothetical protein